MGLQVELKKGRCHDNSTVFGTPSNRESGTVAYWDEEKRDEQTGEEEIIKTYFSMLCLRIY